jgi:hypothetical protein
MIVTLAGLHGKDPVVCSRQVQIIPDVGLENLLDVVRLVFFLKDEL